MRTANRTTGVVLGCVLLCGVHATWAQDWPQWRGSNRDNKVTEFLEPKAWPKALTQKWKITVGVGESSPVLVGNKLYVFARQGADEVTLCLDANTNKELWKDKYKAAAVGGAASGHPGPRSTPAVGEGKVCTLGVAGVVSCLDAETGKVVWQKDTKAKPQFYTSSSPLIADGLCIVYVDALNAYDLSSGELRWQWKGGGTPYGSPVLATIDGVKQIVTPSGGSIAGIALDGKKLWEVKIGGDYNATMGTPVIDGQTVIYSVPVGKGKKGGGGASGTQAFKVEKKGDAFTTSELWKKPQAAHKYNTPLLKDGLLYGLAGPSDVESRTTLFCMDAKTGNTLWTDKTQRGECGTILSAGGVLVELSSDGELLIFEPSKEGYKELAKYRVSDKSGIDGPWACPIIAGNRIYVKDVKDSLTLWTIE